MDDNVTGMSRVASRIAIALLVVASAAVHAYIAQSTFGFEVDVRDFAIWGRRLADIGPAAFYARDYWCDYPPGYIMVAGFLHNIAVALKANEGTSLWLIIVKAPACLSDCVTGWLVWRIASRSFAGKPHGGIWALVAAACYLFNPAAFVDSALWGQVDGVLSVFVIAMFACYLRAFDASKDSHIVIWMAVGSALWAVGITCKLQGALIAPAVLFVFLLLVRRNAHAGLISLGVSFAAALFVAVAVLLPFSPVVGMQALLQNFLETLGSYQFGSVNALNFFTMVGAGWTDQELPFLFLTYRAWGTIFLVLLVLFVVACYVRAEWSDELRRMLFGRSVPARECYSEVSSEEPCERHLEVPCAGERGGVGEQPEHQSEWSKKSERANGELTPVLPCRLSRELVSLPVLLAGVLVVGFFTFSVRVHERYIFYAIALLLVAAVLYRDKYVAVIFAAVSAIETVNLVMVFNGAYFFGDTPFEIIASFLMVVVCLCLLVRTWQLSRSD